MEDTIEVDGTCETVNETEVCDAYVEEAELSSEHTTCTADCNATSSRRLASEEFPIARLLNEDGSTVVFSIFTVTNSSEEAEAILERIVNESFLTKVFGRLGNKSYGKQFVRRRGGRPPQVAVRFVAKTWRGVVLKLAQTHVIEVLPERRWVQPQGCLVSDSVGCTMDKRLHLVGSRAALAIVEFGTTPVPANPQLRVTNDELTVPTIIALKPPSAFPPTLGDSDSGSLRDGAPYSTTAYSALIDAELVRAGLTILVEVIPSAGRLYDLAGFVGAPSEYTIFSIPFYFFGAGEWTAAVYDGARRTLTAEYAGKMSQSKADEFFAKVPVSTFTNVNHPMRKFQERKRA